MPKADPWNRLNELRWQPDSVAKITALESFVREADATGDKKLSYATREALIRAAVFGGATEKALVAFAWCLAHYDKQPDGINLHGLLWQYKWILGAVTEFPTISRERIASLQDDFEQRLKSHGFSLRPLFKLRLQAFREMGCIEEARATFKQWKSAKRDSLADCLACELHEEVTALSALGKYDQAVKKGIALINGTERCTQVPQQTYGRILYPLIQLKRMDEAKSFHARGYPMVAKSRNLLTAIAQHLWAVAAFGDFSRGVRLIEVHTPWAIATNELLSRLLFLHSAGLLFDQITKGRSRRRKVKLPETLPCHRSDSTYSPGDLAKYFNADADRLAHAFDERNGNSFYVERFEADRTLLGS